MTTMKLYPPLLESSIPAFTNIVSIPFQHNALVGMLDYKGILVLVKEINGNVVYTGKIILEDKSLLVLNLASSAFVSSSLNNINWYKFQIAYIDNNNNVGYYSTAAVGKYLGSTTKDNFNVTLSTAYLNGSEFITGTYIHSNDPSEKEYSYRFILKDNEQNILVDTGEKLHDINSPEDTNISSYDYFKCNYCLNASMTYKLYYEIMTINGYKLSAITNIKGNYFDDGINIIPFTIKAILDRDRGSVNVIAKYRSSDDFLTDDPEENRKKISPTVSKITGTFILRRTCSKDNYFKIFDIKTFCLINTPISAINEGILLYKDFTVESGYSYKYYIQLISKNKKVYSLAKSAMFQNKNLYVSFDDSFLYDGERLLNIKFNPQISSFKTNILGTKTDTIGSKYPFISYNGTVNYKEFPIAGLISYNMDEGEDFMKGLFPRNEIRGNLDSSSINSEPLTLTKPSMYNYDYSVTDLVDNNILLEKLFKINVLDFLNNKKPKLFRSPTEGNYAVITMNSSLSPEKALGRMLHNFSCTAYEIMDTDLFVEEIIEKTASLYLLSDDAWERMEGGRNRFFSAEKKTTNYNLLNYNEYVKEVQIREAKPMSVVTLGIITLPEFSKVKLTPITIGATGSYNYRCFSLNEYIKSIYLGDATKKYINKPDFCNFNLYDCLNIVENLFDNITEVLTETMFGKEISINKANNEPIPLIKKFYTQPTSEENGYINILSKIHLLKVRNFDMFEPHKIKYYIGDKFDISNEIAGLKLFDNGRIACSAETSNYLLDNYNNLFSDRLPLDRTDAENLDYYEKNNKNSIYYLKYTMEYIGSDFENDIANNINVGDIPYESIVLLPMETRDIYLNESININTNQNQDFTVFSPTNLIINQCDTDIYYNLFADFTKIYFYEGEQVEEAIEE